MTCVPPYDVYAFVQPLHSDQEPPTICHLHKCPTDSVFLCFNAFQPHKSRGISMKNTPSCEWCYGLRSSSVKRHAEHASGPSDRRQQQEAWYSRGLGVCSACGFTWGPCTQGFMRVHRSLGPKHGRDLGRAKITVFGHEEGDVDL